MSLTGACPGTVLPQISTGVGSSLFVGLGGILGAMLFERYVEKNVTQGEVGCSVHTPSISTNNYEIKITLCE
jgi:hypothetical protein